jgi:uncharacterized protein (TIGR00290 family)
MTSQLARGVLVSWSGGKDSCMALHEIQQARQYEVLALLTTMTEGFDRISMHGVRRVLLERQANALGLPLLEVVISKNASNEEYERKFVDAVRSFDAQVIDSIVFGDLFLEDVKQYRDQFLARHNLRGTYPVWKRDTREFVEQFIALGFKAITTCVDSRRLDSSFVGRTIDYDFLATLPADIDPCGENGEFHTFVFDGPNFSAPVSFLKGEVVKRESFWFCDLLPA